MRTQNIMRHIDIPRRLGFVAAIVTVALLIGAAPALAEETPCVAQPFSQPFLFVEDTSNYILIPGEQADDFEGSGWELSGGARITQATLRDGRRGSVLLMPDGSKAVSPTFCVNTEYQTARGIVENLGGAGPGLGFGVSYGGSPSRYGAHQTGLLSGAKVGEWAVSPRVNMDPEEVAGWQRVTVTLSVGWGRSAGYELYDLYVDPYTR
jgi:hypothetical protein